MAAKELIGSKKLTIRGSVTTGTRTFIMDEGDANLLLPKMNEAWDAANPEVKVHEIFFTPTGKTNAGKNGQEKDFVEVNYSNEPFISYQDKLTVEISPEIINIGEGRTWTVATGKAAVPITTLVPRIVYSYRVTRGFYPDNNLITDVLGKTNANQTELDTGYFDNFLGGNKKIIFEIGTLLCIGAEISEAMDWTGRVWIITYKLLYKNYPINPATGLPILTILPHEAIWNVNTAGVGLWDYFAEPLYQTAIYNLDADAYQVIPKQIKGE